MKRKILIGFMLMSLAGGVLATTNDLCTKFVPAVAKHFDDNYNLDKIVVTRSGKYISGTIAHSVGNHVANATFTQGICTGNQFNFSWRTSAFYGSFTGTLACTNQIYTLENSQASVNGAPVYIGTMVSPASGPCPPKT